MSNEYKPLTKRQIEEDAQVIANYVVLSTIEEELNDAREAAEDPDTTYEALSDVVAVLERACEVLNGE